MKEAYPERLSPSPSTSTKKTPENLKEDPDDLKQQRKGI